MQNISSSVRETVQFLKERTGPNPPLVGIVLGTGLGSLIKHISITETISYADIPNFPLSTVESHKGQLVFGTIGQTPVVVMQGRFHFYEGYSLQQVTFPVRVLKGLGLEYLLLSNASGGLNLDFSKGDLVLIEDHINLLPDNPLKGVSDPELGPRFTDMSRPYDPGLNKILKEAAVAAGTSVREGIYVSVMGPNLETRAEYRWLRSMGADMVGMSTVPEVIVANQVGLKCSAISVITDECDPDNLKKVDIQEIIAVANTADEKLARVFTAAIQALGK
jgi:purine-nucleoside phosphorylase